MSSINKYIAIIYLALIGLPSVAQETTSTEKEKEKEQDTVKISFVPKGLRLGVDLIGATKTIIDSDKRELEFSADIELHRYLVNFEYGQFEVSRLGSDASIYQNKGSYFRTGIDVNLLKKDTDINVLFFGLRYGKATFDDQLQYLQTNALFGDLSYDRTNTNLNARWLEMATGLKLRIINNFWLGFTGRFKFSLKIDESGTLKSHDIPGYGKASEESYWGFNYQLMYRIPFGKNN